MLVMMKFKVSKMNVVCIQYECDLISLILKKNVEKRVVIEFYLVFELKFK
jgi:hypothetical protein